MTISAVVKDDAENPIWGENVPAKIGDLETLFHLSDQGGGNYQGTIETANINEGTFVWPSQLKRKDTYQPRLQKV